jgi:hypothetical protein
MRVAQQSRPAGVGPGRSTGRGSLRTHSARSPPQAGRARHRSRGVDQRHTCLVVRSYARSRWQAAGRLCLRAAERGEKNGSRQWAVGSRAENQRVAGEAARRGGEFIHGRGVFSSASPASGRSGSPSGNGAAARYGRLVRQTSAGSGYSIVTPVGPATDPGKVPTGRPPQARSTATGQAASAATGSIRRPAARQAGAKSGCRRIVQAQVRT